MAGPRWQRHIKYSQSDLTGSDLRRWLYPVFALAVGTMMSFLLFVLLYRLLADWGPFTAQYLGPVRDEDERWGRIVIATLLLVVLGWGVSCVGLAVLDVCARGMSPRISLRAWITSVVVAALSLGLTILAIRAR